MLTALRDLQQCPAPAAPSVTRSVATLDERTALRDHRASGNQVESAGGRLA
ncbi:hypothetical protein ACH47C_40765 [Streptomyces rishiriensis]|uniref:hypothetical protein n=1 Tax=Streptomyces rishiriensis TaxID=68264 RepID=UPI0033E6AE70